MLLLIYFLLLFLLFLKEMVTLDQRLLSKPPLGWFCFLVHYFIQFRMYDGSCTSVECGSWEGTIFDSHLHSWIPSIWRAAKRGSARPGRSHCINLVGDDYVRCERKRRVREAVHFCSCILPTPCTNKNEVSTHRVCRYLVKCIWGSGTSARFRYKFNKDYD